MPGFSDDFSRASRNAANGGVMISQESYIQLMDIPPIPYLDKIFIKLTEVRTDHSNYIEDLIEKEFNSQYDFEIENLRRSISQGISYYSILDTFFTITLDAAIIICLFGLISSSYSTIIERKKEIGIIRTLGLKGNQINHLFTIEALIIMFSSGSVGMLVGYLTGLLLATSLNLLSDLPTPTNFPFQSAINVFIVSTIFTFIGMYLLLRKLRKKKIVEIYRETM
jgi:ABC-type antimicrobial peptide transport system permease subunit